MAPAAATPSDGGSFLRSPQKAALRWAVCACGVFVLFGGLYYSFSPQTFGFKTVSGLDVGHLHSRTKATVVSVCKTSEKRVLVTGAAGFIGSHSSLGLAKIGYAVVGIDNFNTYYPVSLKLSREADLNMQGIPVVHADINDYELLQDLFSACPFTHVLHLAAQAGVRYAATHPFTYIESNVHGSVTLLEVMRNQKTIPRLIYASSSSVYGLSKSLPFSERDRVDVPASLYAATKRSQELLTFTYFHNFGMSATGLRFFTVYGPSGRPDMSVFSFTRNILDGKPIKLFLGPNNQTLSRDFTYVDDIVRGVLQSVELAPQSSSFRTFNLGNSRVVTVEEMVRTLESLIGKKANVQYIVRPTVGEVLLTNANITRASRFLQYNPRTEIADGLRSWLLWFNKYTKNGTAYQPDMSSYVPS